jgi:hypothetical protein
VLEFAIRTWGKRIETLESVRKSELKRGAGRGDVRREKRAGEMKHRM